MRTDTTLRAGRPRAGFTAIELMVVLIVILVLIGLAVPGLVGAMRKGSVNDAANAIMRVSSQARQFARTRPAPSTTPGSPPAAYFGLVIVGDEQPNYVALTWGTSCTKADIYIQRQWGSGDDRTNFATYLGAPPELKNGNPIPVSKLLFNRNVIVYTGTVQDPDPANPNVKPLESQPGQEIGWFYQFRTGYPIRPNPRGTPPQPNSPNVNIGVDPLAPGVDPAALTGITIDAVFPNDLRHLTLRTTDGRYTSAIAIYQIGLANVQDL
ncbi:MAG: prepilin-type N-terminal cleavage/methylation domain-containing protein [Planctomycetes bacterium]|nr:prepilin-type N-terminal cleavage/methylation domain-containing protein [Planctomycetota bacterium]